MSCWFFRIVVANIVDVARGKREAGPVGFELDFGYPFFPFSGCFARLASGEFFFGFSFGLFVPYSFEHFLIGLDFIGPVFG
jgi:hypothetical protein